MNMNGFENCKNGLMIKTTKLQKKIRDAIEQNKEVS